VNGEPVKGLNYLAFVGNGLNTLSISANKIDTNLLVSGNVWWEPLGPYGRNPVNHATCTMIIRLPESSHSVRVPRLQDPGRTVFSDLDQSSPENTSIYNSDGVQPLRTGAFARGVTLQDAT